MNKYGISEAKSQVGFRTFSVKRVGSRFVGAWQKLSAGFGVTSKKVVAGVTIFVMLATVFQIASSEVILAADTGYKTPTFASTDSDYNDWDVNTVSNVQTSNNSYASDNDESDQQGYEDFNFGAIPNGSVIKGITVKVEAKSSDTSGCELQVSLSGNNGNSFTSSIEKSLDGSDTEYTFGSASDLWGGAWSTASFSNDNFVYRMAFDDTSGNNCQNSTVSVDQIQVRVTYDPPVANPDLANSCGLDIALVLDSSGSIDNTELGQMKTAFNGFVDAFLPETPTEFSVTDFDDTAAVLQAFTGTQAQITSAINAPTSGGATNWEDGLKKARSTFSSDRPDKADLIVFASDGEPNRYGNPAQGSSSGFDSTSFAAAVAEANSIKGSGIKIITLGIGVSGSNANNLKALSDSDDYYDASSFSTLQTTLAQLASDLCGGTVTVTKLIDADGDLQTTNDQTPGDDWDFTVDGNIYATDQTGKTEPIQLETGEYDVIESLHNNYDLIYADCKITNLQGTPNTGTFDNTDSVDDLVIGQLDIVSCTFINSPKDGKLIVKKQVTNDDGGTKKADDFKINVTINNGSPEEITGSVDGVEIVVPTGASFSVTESPQFDYAPDTSDVDCSGVMPINGNVICTVVNDDPEPTTGTLTIYKTVVNDNGGSAVAEDFTPTLSTLSDPPVTTSYKFGESIVLQPGTYQVDETGPSGYSKSYIENQATNCTSTGQITIEAGLSYICYITNNDMPASITVVKNVVGDGAPDDSSQFELWINPEQGDSVSAINGMPVGVNPGTYTVSETQKSGYQASFSGDCSKNGSITVALGDSKTCTITNTYIPPEDPTIFNFIKYVCESYGDIVGNPSADVADDTGGKYTQFSNYPNFGGTIKPVNPSEKPEGCVGSADWQFLLSSDQNQTQNTQTVGYTNGSGVLQVAYSDLNAGLQETLDQGGLMWVSEVERSGYGFGALRCYKDVLNGDNLEYISFGDGKMPKGNIYCIAYNVANEVEPCEQVTISGIMSDITNTFKGLTLTDPGNSSDDSLFTGGTPGSAVVAGPVGFPGAWDSASGDPDVTGASWINDTANQPSNPADSGGDGSVDSWRLFSKTINISAGATSISSPVLHFTSDNSVKAYLDDVLIDSHNSFSTVKDTVALSLTPGTHTLEFVVKNDAYQGPDNPTGLLYKLDNITYCDGGNGGQHSVSGKVYHDNNSQNGEYDPGQESGLEGWTVQLFKKADGETLVDTDISDANGDYSFSGLVPGCYIIREVLQSGWAQTDPTVEDDALQGVVVDHEYLVSLGGAICFEDSRLDKITGLFIKSANATALPVFDVTDLNFGNIQRDDSSTSDGGSSSSGSRDDDDGRVLGDSTGLPYKQPEVLGASTELPRTGTPISTFLMLLASLGIILVPSLVKAKSSQE